MTIYERAVELIGDGMRIGLGSGRAASRFVEILGERVRAGRLNVVGLPTSRATEALARQVGIPLTTPADAGTLDLTVDGADEVDLNLDLIKGYGRCLVREKIVAAMSRRLVILAVEVVPFGLPLCERRLRELGCRPTAYQEGDQLFVTDNGNHILDCEVGPLADARQLEADIRAIPGVVGTGLFLGMADMVLVGEGTDFRLKVERVRDRSS
jgi:ribose 5-phosphate isomerase A